MKMRFQLSDKRSKKQNLKLLKHNTSFNILQQNVSQIFATWINRLCYCLGQLSFITDRESTKNHLPKCFKPGYLDVYLIRKFKQRRRRRLGKRRLKNERVFLLQMSRMADGMYSACLTASQLS